MQIKTKNIAVLIFTRSLEDEAKSKRFVYNNHRLNKNVARLLIEHTTKTAYSSNFPTFVIDSNLQKGDSFGERYANAFEYVFNRGYDTVISLGNDNPTLSVSDIQLAAEVFDNNNVVVGPAKDGGAYLIGLSSLSYNRQKFINLRWNTSLVLNDLKEYADGYGYTLIHSQADIDDNKGLLEICRTHFYRNQLCQRILHTINSFEIFSIKNTLHISTQFFNTQSHLRAPPSFY
jgi:glycosyltransferase A (GT-A) superfamily protein (DUF2064 family)